MFELQRKVEQRIKVTVVYCGRIMEAWRLLSFQGSSKENPLRLPPKSQLHEEVTLPVVLLSDNVETPFMKKGFYGLI